MIRISAGMKREKAKCLKAEGVVEIADLAPTSLYFNKLIRLGTCVRSEKA